MWLIPLLRGSIKQAWSISRETIGGAAFGWFNTFWASFDECRSLFRPMQFWEILEQRNNSIAIHGLFMCIPLKMRRFPDVFQLLWKSCHYSASFPLFLISFEHNIVRLLILLFQALTKISHDFQKSIFRPQLTIPPSLLKYIFLLTQPTWFTSKFLIFSYSVSFPRFSSSSHLLNDYCSRTQS